GKSPVPGRCFVRDTPRGVEYDAPRAAETSRICFARRSEQNHGTTSLEKTHRPLWPHRKSADGKPRTEWTLSFSGSGPRRLTLRNIVLRNARGAWCPGLTLGALRPELRLGAGGPELRLGALPPARGDLHVEPRREVALFIDLENVREGIRQAYGVELAPSLLIE